MPDELIVTYLEMSDPTQFVPAFIPLTDAHVAQIRLTVTEYRALYMAVGGHLMWRDRLTMADDTLQALLDHAEIHVLYHQDAIAGYIELLPKEDSIEVIYFGLLPAYHGLGYGKHLLSVGIARAWALGGKRVTLNTCNLDGIHALANYKKRGFQVICETREPLPARYQD